MKGNKEVIEVLKEVLTGELTAINQYFLHGRMCKDWGYERIADVIMKESIDEMKHAQKVIDRILFLEGVPNLQKLSPLSIGENVEEQLKADLGLELKAIERLKKGVEVCHKSADFHSRELLEQILADEEHHVDWIESQLHIIKEVGLDNYLSQQIHEKS